MSADLIQFRTRSQQEEQELIDMVVEMIKKDDFFIFLSHKSRDTNECSFVTNVSPDKYNIYLRGLLSSGEAMLNQTHPIVFK